MNSQALTCKYNDCDLIYERPVTLSCGNTLCQHHLKEMINDQTLKCCFCHKKHSVPEDGFGINKAFVQIIENYFETNSKRKEINELYKKLVESINDYETIDQNDYIDAYFGDIENKCKLHQENLKKKIDEKSNEITKQLKHKKEKCIINRDKIKTEKRLFDELKNNWLPLLMRKLRTPDLSQHEYENLSTMFKEKIGQVEDESKRFKNDLLLGESIEFEKSGLFGDLIIKTNRISENQNPLLIQSFNQHTLAIRSIIVDEKSNRLISGSVDRSIKIWSLETGECLKTLQDHRDWVTCILIISNNRFISSSVDKTIKIWNINSYECLNTLKNKNGIYSLCSISNNQIACGCLNGTIVIWNLDKSKKVKTFKAHNDWIPSLILADKTKLISCSAEKDIKIKIWSLNHNNNYECLNVFQNHADRISFLDLTLNDCNLVSCSDDKSMKIWEIETGKLLKSIQFDDIIYCIKVLDERLIAIGLFNGEIKIYDLVKDKCVKSFMAHTTFIYRLNSLSNGNLLSASGKGEIKLWKI